MSSSSLPSTEGAQHHASDCCLNCGTVLAPEAKFCHACGQDTANHPPSLFEFVHEFVAHYVALEGALWRSLKGLAFRPGFLTTEYLAGRKARYVQPLRLLLTLGFVFFLLVKFSPDESVQAAAANKDTQEESLAVPSGASAASAPAAAGSAPTMVRGPVSVMVLPDAASRPASASGVEIETEGLPAWLQPRVDAMVDRWTQSSDAEVKLMMAKVRGLLPYAVLCSLPFFAAILSLVFWWRRLPYGAHFVFAMHLHAFFYLTLAVALFIPTEFLGWLTFAWLVAYPLLAIRRVYAKSWWSAVGSSAVVFVLHMALQGFMFVSVFAVGALTP
ncbi:MAG: DUF3667 domain-containing protein [Ideonella sp.]|nr:DUF3667 domain-containing protein [Ideonella sp.]